MKTIRRLLYRDIVSSVLFVALAFLSLFFFIDFVDDLDEIGRRGRTVWHVALAALYEVPGHLYELLPIAVLIGTIYSLARMAQASEYTLLRTGGLGPGRALRLLAVLGVAFGTLNFVIGDFVVPASERAAVLLKAQFSGGLRVGRAGAWLKEKHDSPSGERSVSVNVAGTSASGELEGIRVYEFDADGRLAERINAHQGRVGADGTWALAFVERTIWPRGIESAAAASAPRRVESEKLPALKWASALNAGTVAAAVLPVNTMTTLELWRYSSHLSAHEQAAERHQISFWKKALYPLSCLVMVGLALPFAYMQPRSGGVSLKVFGGIMLGISFVLLNNLAGHIGVLRSWTPWVVAATPSALFLLMSLGAFAWLVRYR